MTKVNYGQQIVEIREMTKEEAKEQGWDYCLPHQLPPVLILEDGTRIFPSQDDEGNGPGKLFGILPNGENVHVIPEK